MTGSPTTKRFDCITLGETMLRLSPPGTQRLEQTRSLGLHIGGAESNFAAALARMGQRVAWVSRLPQNPLGLQTAQAIRQQGVNIEGVRWAENERMGLYFVEHGPAPRGVRVWYDRAGSAASRMSPEDLPLDMIAASRWLHLTGITPALSAGCAATAQAAMQHARQHGLMISFDVNYRALLWPPEQAASILEPLCQEADYVTAALRDAVSLFGAPDRADQAAQALQARWGGTVLITSGDSGAVACDGIQITNGAAFLTTIVDRLGAGDAFSAGVICRLLEAAPLADALNFGAALAALKLTIEGDMALVNRSEVEALIAGGLSGLQR